MLGGHVDRSTVRQFLAGDLLAILVFVVIGEHHHNVDIVADPAAVVHTAVPFYVGWVLVAPLAGAYSRRARESWVALVGTTVVAWLVADLVAMGLRDMAVFRGEATPVFYLVAAAFGGLLLLVWRALVTAFQ